MRGNSHAYHNQTGANSGSPDGMYGVGYHVRHVEWSTVAGKKKKRSRTQRLNGIENEKC